MTEARFQIVDDDAPARIVLSGHIDLALIEGLKAAVDAWQPDPETGLIVDLREARDFDPDARRALVEVHRALADKVRRQTYLAGSSRLRGLSLWVMHMAGDVTARAVGSGAQAKRWLAGDKGRLEVSFGKVGVESVPPRALRGIGGGKLSFAERLGSTAIGWISRLTVGYWPAFTREMVRTYGLDGVERWGRAVEKTINTLSERYGDETAQGLIAMAAMWNGCAYCTTGHLYAVNLLYFKRTGELFPIDEREVPRWYTLTDERLVDRIVGRLEGDAFADLARLIRRQYRMRLEGDALEPTEDDAFIELANAAFDLVNECSIVIEAANVPPLHEGAARNRGVQKAYAQKRGRKPGAVIPPPM